MLRQRIDSPYGHLTAIWTASGLYACAFDPSENAAEAVDGGAQSTTLGTMPLGTMHSSALELERAFVEYFERGEFVWDLNGLDWSGVPEFQRAVLRECYAIPAGSTLTYGELARRVGRPKAARAVGSAMARNRWPILIPCHRVVGSTGKLTGYSGTGGLETKRKLIAMEQEHAAFELSVS